MNLYYNNRLFFNIENRLARIELNDNKIELIFVDNTKCELEFDSNADYLDSAEYTVEEKNVTISILADGAFRYLMTSLNNKETFCDLDDFVFNFCKIHNRQRKTGIEIDNMLKQWQ